jgi:hypothetical protein
MRFIRLFFDFNFAQLFFACFLCFFGLFFCLSRSFFASKFFARSRTFSFLSSFLFYCLPGLFVSYNRLLQLFICRRTLSLTFCLFQRGCTFTHLSNFYSPKEQSLGHVPGSVRTSKQGYEGPTGDTLKKVERQRQRTAADKKLQ